MHLRLDALAPLPASHLLTPPPRSAASPTASPPLRPARWCRSTTTRCTRPPSSWGCCPAAPCWPTASSAHWTPVRGGGRRERAGGKRRAGEGRARWDRRRGGGAAGAGRRGECAGAPCATGLSSPSSCAPPPPTFQHLRIPLSPSCFLSTLKLPSPPPLPPPPRPPPATEQDDSDWPGPKAWPATMGLISFFALNVFIQALRVRHLRGLGVGGVGGRRPWRVGTTS